MTDIRTRLEDSLGPAYTIERELGGGGMSRVFLARDSALDRRVVVKVLPSHFESAASVERFQREIAVAAKLQHPHIVPLLIAGDASGMPYFTMPFIRNESLRARLATGPIPLSDALRILRGIASALEHAHSNGVLHRDIKPANILLSVGVPMVTDFGIAKALDVAADEAAESEPASPSQGFDWPLITGAGTALGTPAYMSPEQARGDARADHRSDLYAFGVVAYEMLAGTPPFTAERTEDLMAALIFTPPRHLSSICPGVPPSLAALVMRCLAKSPEDRPDSASEIVSALDAMSTPSEGSRAIITSPPRRWSRGLAVSAAVFLALFGGSLVWRHVRSGARGERSAVSATAGAATATRTSWTGPRAGASDSQSRGQSSRAIGVSGPRDAISPRLVVDNCNSVLLGTPSARVFDLCGWHSVERGDYPQGLSLIKRAVAMDSTDPVIRSDYAKALLWDFRWDEAYAEAMRAIGDDPTLPEPRAIVAMVLARRAVPAADDYEELGVWVEHAPVESPSVRAAREVLANYTWLSHGVHPEVEGLILAMQGDRQRALMIATDLAQRAHAGIGEIAGVAELYAQLGYREEALRWLSEAVMRGRFVSPFAPGFVWFAGDPRFADIVQRMGLKPSG